MTGRGRGALGIVVAVIAVLGATGCSGSGGQPTRSVTAALLQSDVLALSNAAAANDAARAESQLVVLRKDIASALATGAITAAKAHRLRQDLAAVHADLVASSSASGARTPTPTPTPSHTKSAAKTARTTRDGQQKQQQEQQQEQLDVQPAPHHPKHHPPRGPDGHGPPGQHKGPGHGHA